LELVFHRFKYLQISVSSDASRSWISIAKTAKLPASKGMAADFAELLSYMKDGL